MRNQRGMTLIEILIVISILTLITTVLLLSFEGTKAKFEVEQFKDQLQRDINWALSYADIHQQVVYFFILKDQNTYFFQVNSQVVLQRIYNKNFRVEDNLAFHRIIIQANGTVSNFGTLKIYIDSKMIAALFIEMNTGVIREETY